MKQPLVRPEKVFAICQLIGISLMFLLWLLDGETSGFFVIVVLAMMSMMRMRFPKLKHTVLIDIAFCIIMSAEWGFAAYSLALPLFSAMYLGVYFAVIAGAYLFFEFNELFAAMLISSALCGFFLRFWMLEYTQKLQLRDKSARRHYEMENLQGDLSAALVDVERAAGIAERTRIARDIHDNAGHEIVAAYISFQAIRKMLGSGKAEITEIIEMYDDALGRLNNGTSKIRETAHNLQSAVLIGAEGLSEACRQFPISCPIDFRIYGDTTRIPMYVWNVLSSCLNECLTNVARHSKAKNVSVTLDAALHIVRLCVENDGVYKSATDRLGMGLRNLRQRTAAIGGSLSVDVVGNTEQQSRRPGRGLKVAARPDEVFRVICVIPIEEKGV